MKLPLALLAILSISLAACGDKAATENTDDAESSRQETVFDPQLEALKRAKEVEQQMKDAEERHRREMEENGM